MKNMFLEISQNSQENICARVAFLIKLQALPNRLKTSENQVFSDVFRRLRSACNFIKKEILAQVFSCEFCEFSKNIFFTEHLLTTASYIQDV